jgi:hypothetical protein
MSLSHRGAEFSQVMPNSNLPDQVHADSAPSKPSARPERWLLIAMESLVYALMLGPLWLLGKSPSSVELVQFAVLALLLVLWASRILLNGEFTWKKCPVGLCLALILSVVMIIPLPRPILEWLSPPTARFYDQFLPHEPEVLIDRQPRAQAWPPPGSTLSVYPAATRDAAIHFLALFVLFAIVRNNLASVEHLRRLSVLALVNGTLVARTSVGCRRCRTAIASRLGSTGAARWNSRRCIFLRSSRGVGSFSRRQRSWNSYCRTIPKCCWLPDCMSSPTMPLGNGFWRKPSACFRTGRHQRRPMTITPRQ